jgi:general secretion pathway protein I
MNHQLKVIARRSARSGGFTLVEVLATVLLMAIVVPVVNRGLAAATLAAGSARSRTEGAGLAQSKLTELTVNSLWQNGNLSGDFGPDWSQYTWKATVTNWVGDTQDVGLQQLDIQVLWTERNRPESITVSGLVYIRPQPTS